MVPCPVVVGMRLRVSVVMVVVPGWGRVRLLPVESDPVGLDGRADAAPKLQARTMVYQLLLEPMQPGLEPAMAPDGDRLEGRDARQLPQIALRTLGLELRQDLQEVGFGAQNQIRGSEHHGILGGLVVTLGHREECDVAVLAQVEARRTHQIADVLDEQEVHALQIQPMQGLVDHVGVQMTGTAGGDLDRGHPLGGHWPAW